MTIRARGEDWRAGSYTTHECGTPPVEAYLCPVAKRSLEGWVDDGTVEEERLASWVEADRAGALRECGQGVVCLDVVTEFEIGGGPRRRGRKGTCGFSGSQTRTGSQIRTTFRTGVRSGDRLSGFTS